MTNECSTTHPDHDDNERWADSEGRCVYCGRNYYEREHGKMEADNTALRKQNQALVEAMNDWDKHWFNCRTCSPKKFCMTGRELRGKMLDLLASETKEPKE